MVRNLVRAFVLIAALPAQAADKVNFGATLSMTDLPFFIAEKRGWFREENIELNTVLFDSAARMIAPLASGDLDAGAGGPSAALYNAIARNIGMRIVADRSRAAPGRYSQILLVRKALIDSGRVKTLADLKGLKVASAAPGSSAMGTLNRIYRQTGMKETDIERVYMGFPQQIVALQNGAADVAFPTEPFASEAVRRGFAVAFMTDDEIYPDHQMSVMLYGDAFRLKRKDVALRFMRGYLRGVRAQNESIINGKLAGRDAEEFVSLIAENTNVKDKDFLRTVTMSYTASDGRPNVDSLREDFEVFRAAGLIEGKITLEEALDLWFAETASTQLDKTAAPK